MGREIRGPAVLWKGTGDVLARGFLVPDTVTPKAIVMRRDDVQNNDCGDRRWQR